MAELTEQQKISIAHSLNTIEMQLEEIKSKDLNETQKKIVACFDEFLSLHKRSE